jgi:anti-anti-sigma regulatory factor
VTIKIEFIARADHSILRLTGQIEAEHLSELETEIAAATKPVVIEMREVTLVDLDVVRFLIKCEAEGITLRGCPAYIQEWIDRERQNEI